MKIPKEETPIRKQSATHERTVPAWIRCMLASLLLFIATLTTNATNWYVDNVATGSKNGTTWANAWTSFSSVVWGSSGVKAGDTLFISGGSTSKKYTATVDGFLNIGASGTSASRITVRVGQDSGHNGTVILDGGGHSSIIKCYQSYVTLDGGYNGQIHLNVTNVSQSLDTTAMDFYGATDPRIYYVDVSTANVGIASYYITRGEIAYCNIHDIRQEAAIKLIGGNSGGTAYDVTRVHNNTIQVNKLSDGSGSGPDGIQCCPGLTFYSNHIYGAVGTLTSTGQHQDLMQLEAHYIKIYNNVFENGGDSLIDQDTMSNDTAGYLQIYNNVFRRTDKSGTVAIRCYNSYGWALSYIKDLVIDNNTFIDGAEEGNSYGVAINLRSLSPAISVQNVHIRNNIIYNCGNAAGSRPVLWVSGFSQTGWDIDYNLINPGSHGTTTLTFDGYPNFVQAHGQTAAPSFTSYSVGASGNDFRLATSDTAAVDKGTALSYFSTDINNNARPQGKAWDIGAFEAISGTSAPVMAITPATQDFGSLTLGTTADLTFVVKNTGTGTLSGTATVAAPFNVISGSPYSIPAGQSQSVTVRFSPSAVGTNLQTVTFSGANGATTRVQGVGMAQTSPLIQVNPTSLSFGSILAGATADQTFTVQNIGNATLSGSASVSAPFSILAGTPYNLAPGASQTLTIRYSPTAVGTNTQTVVCSGGGTGSIAISGSAYLAAPNSSTGIPVSAAQITAPFVLSGNYIYQASETGLATGGRATFSFVLTNSASYVLQAVLNAPGDGANSLFFNIDGEPQDPSMIWDIPIAAGFQLQTGSWRGTGTFDNSQYAPKVFTLAAGTHQLVIRAREANVQLQTISIVPLPTAPKNVRIVSY